MGSQISQGASSNFTSAPGVSANGSSAAAGKPSSSGGFTNLQNYLNANADQTQGLGQKISNNIQNEANQGFSGLGESSNQFKTDTDKATDNINSLDQSTIPQTFMKAVSNPSQLQDSDVQAIANVQKNATAGGATQGSQITDPNTLALSSPKDLTAYSSYNDSVGKLQNASNDVNNTMSESGRQQLLQQNYARPDYNQGQQHLDQLLLQGNPQNQQRFQDLQSQLIGTTSTSPDSNQQVSNYTNYTGPASTIQGQEAEAQKNANDYLTQTKGNLANSYNTIQSYLYGTGPGSAPLNVSIPAPQIVDPFIDRGGFNSGGSLRGTPPVDISNGGLLGYTSQQAQNQVAAKNADELAAYNKALQAPNLYNSTTDKYAPGNWEDVALQNESQSPQYASLSKDQLDAIQTQLAPNTAANQATLANAVDPNTVAVINALNKLAANGNTGIAVPGQSGTQAVGSGYGIPNFSNINVQALLNAADAQYVANNHIPNRTPIG